MASSSVFLAQPFDPTGRNPISLSRLGPENRQGDAKGPARVASRWDLIGVSARTASGKRRKVQLVPGNPIDYPRIMETHFTWIPAYAEIARRLAHWEDRQRDLITFVERLRKDGLTVTPMMDKDEKGARFLLEEIDPFSFLGTFNRRISNDQRFAILAEVLKFLGATVALPTDFSGIPLVNNQKSWFFAYRPGPR